VTKAEPTARLAGRAFDVGRAAWNACANPDASPGPHPFTRYEFFDACEASGSATAKTGWRPLHLVVERGDRIEGILPLYLKNHSQGEYVFDHAWADALERAGGDSIPNSRRACRSRRRPDGVS
jgi:predicted N-acyltransferase